MRCLLCSIQKDPREELKFSLMGLLVLISRGELEASKILDGVCSEHLQEAAREVFRVKSSTELRRGAVVLPFSRG